MRIKDLTQYEILKVREERRGLCREKISVSLGYLLLWNGVYINSTF